MKITIQTLGLAFGGASKASAFEQAGIPFFDNWEALMGQIETGGRIERER